MGRAGMIPHSIAAKSYADVKGRCDSVSSDECWMICMSGSYKGPISELMHSQLTRIPYARNDETLRRKHSNTITDFSYPSRPSNHHAHSVKCDKSFEESSLYSGREDQHI
jgi:hypothetical protein